jgi:Na+/H+ antiporter 1/Thioredoxin
VFRHKPLSGSDLARRAAVLVERITDPKQFWDAHVTLMTRSGELTEDDLVAVAQKFGLPPEDSEAGKEQIKRAKERVEADERSARASGVIFTPTFFINRRRYDGPWDESSFTDAMLGRLGHRVRTAALDFATWAPSAGILLLLATIIAIVLTNSPFGPSFQAFWQENFGFTFGGESFAMPLLYWVNDWLLFIAGQAFPMATDFAAAKIAVFAASIVSALIGVAILWANEIQTSLRVPPRHRRRTETLAAGARWKPRSKVSGRPALTPTARSRTTVRPAALPVVSQGPWRVPQPEETPALAVPAPAPSVHHRIDWPTIRQGR